MLLLVGLGNPGPRHAGNRHNIGFMAVDAIARRHGFGPPRNRFGGECREGLLDGAKTLILKPQTYMNLSGQSVGEAMRFYKLKPADIVVLYDEIDLAPGKLRIKTGGGSAGHNGVRSIQAHIGPDFRRLRLGVGHPGAKALVERHVLSDFAKADAQWLVPLLDAVAAEAPWLAKGDDGRFATAVALRLGNPPADGKDA
ncbi:MAG: aminoacyl-tRNA hydrolase [Alphaproteobacteria bacterium]|nr:MAG: aminoacyl-tRNA hydrolase [Alphaproteobacteria bacterium]